LRQAASIALPKTPFFAALRQTLVAPRSSPGAFYRDEHVGIVFGEVVLVFGRELDHAAGFVRVAQRGEDFSGYAEVRMVHVRVLFSFGESKGQLAEVFGSHVDSRVQIADFGLRTVRNYKSTIYNLQSAILPRW